MLIIHKKETLIIGGGGGSIFFTSERYHQKQILTCGWMHYAGPSYTLFLRENYIEELKKRGPRRGLGVDFLQILA